MYRAEVGAQSEEMCTGEQQAQLAQSWQNEVETQPMLTMCVSGPQTEL